MGNIQLDEFELNPSGKWTHKLLVKNWDYLTKSVGKRYLPRKFIGMGAYGVVYDTYSPEFVFKVTTDSTEGFFINTIAELKKIRGFSEDLLLGIPTFMYAIRLDDTYRREPVHCIVREKVVPGNEGIAKYFHHVDGRAPVDYVQSSIRELMRVVNGYYNTANKHNSYFFAKNIWRKHYDKKTGKYRFGSEAQIDRIVLALEDMRDRIFEMTNNEELQYIGNTLDFFFQNNIYFLDVRPPNIGCAMRDGSPNLVLFDTGVVVHIDTEIAS